MLTMGVKDLWKLLAKAKSKVSMGENRGKTLAVDLSYWVCEFSSVKGKVACMHNHPVFVCDQFNLLLS